MISGWSLASMANVDRSGGIATAARTNGCRRSSRTWSPPRRSRSSARSSIGPATALPTLSPRNVGAYRITRVAGGDPVASTGPPRSCAAIATSSNRASVLGMPRSVAKRSTRLAERLRVEDGTCLGADQADVVVAVDPDPPGQRLGRAERLVEHAVAELLERARGMPGLDDGRARPGADHVDREVVVVHDEQPSRGQVVARDGRAPEGPETSTEVTARRVREDHDLDGWIGGQQGVADHHEIAAQRGVVGGSQDDAAAQWKVSGKAEGGADHERPQADDHGAHRASTSSSMTRSVAPASRWAKWACTNVSTRSDR